MAIERLSQSDVAILETSQITLETEFPILNTEVSTEVQPRSTPLETIIRKPDIQPDFEPDILQNGLEDQEESENLTFDELFTTYQSRIYRFVLGKVGDSELAEDLTQQAFMNAFDSIQTNVKPIKPSGKWIYTIARNLVTDYNRRSVNTHELIEPLAINSGEEVEAQVILQSEEKILLPNSLKTLTQQQYDVVVLKLRGLSNPEISKVLGIPVGAVKSRYQRAKDRIIRMKNCNDSGTSRRIRSRRSPKAMTLYYKQLKELREQNLTNADIAAKLGVSLYSIIKSVKVLAKRGELDLRLAGMRQSVDKDKRDSEVRIFRELNLENKEIAWKLGISVNSVNKSIGRLLARREIERRGHGPKKFIA